MDRNIQRQRSSDERWRTRRKRTRKTKNNHHWWNLDNYCSPCPCSWDDNERSRTFREDNRWLFLVVQHLTSRKLYCSISTVMLITILFLLAGYVCKCIFLFVELKDDHLEVEGLCSVLQTTRSTHCWHGPSKYCNAIYCNSMKSSRKWLETMSTLMESTVSLSTIDRVLQRNRLSIKQVYREESKI